MERQIIYTDGSAIPNPGTGGWGWIRSDGTHAYGGERGTTNNRMELTAILEALKAMPDASGPLVYSDSQYCVKGLTVWRPGWRKKDWKRGASPMPNRDLWMALETELARTRARMQWVKGHSGNVGNERADKLAEKGRRLMGPKKRAAGESNSP